MRESWLHPSNFIMPIFVHEEGSTNQPIPSMPGINRLAYGKNVIDYVSEARSYGVNQVVIFPKVSPLPTRYCILLLTSHLLMLNVAILL
jgi:porphobilinogen synthase